MKNTRIPSVPLFVHDPFFSIWSPADHANEATTTSWNDKEMPVTAVLTLDGAAYSVVGRSETLPKLPQVGLAVTPTQTHYTFANAAVQLDVTFAQHFDLADLQSVSESITYVQMRLTVLDGGQHQAALDWRFDGSITYERLCDNRLLTKRLTVGDTQAVWLGKARQTPLGDSGDQNNIDWGYLYLACANQPGATVAAAQDWNQQGLAAHFDLTQLPVATLLVAYDDLHAIDYFGTVQNAYWKAAAPSLPALLAKRLPQTTAILADCERLDAKILDLAGSVGGADYQLICATAYRQAIAAHKLIRDENGEPVFLSKENNSNGCIGTVDVSYPSIPLFLAFNPVLVEGMMRPIMRFAALPVWHFDFAPHDVGRYPYATGQVYGLDTTAGLDDGTRQEQGDTAALLYQYPAETNAYDLRYQMPVEECGDMIIMASTVDLLLHDDFLVTHHDQLIAWSQFLIRNGQDPDNQLCTDDFAGHLAHNVNLSLKAIVALGALGKALATHAEFAQEGRELSATAQKMAAIWRDSARSETDTRLAFDQANTWALKYNLVWDEVLKLNLFDEGVGQRELARYQRESNRYGAPLDNRATYTKVDWLLWVATMSQDKAQLAQLIAPVARYLNETPTRVPFSDWYDTVSGEWVSFRNRTVIGGVFMPLLKALQRF
ncbi:glutaminase domain-containing protein [Lacticaseibacillus suihuaensis]